VPSRKTKNYKEANEIIKTLQSNNFYCECPCGCGEEIALRDAGLFYLDNFTAEAEGVYQEYLEDIKTQRKELKDRRVNMKVRPERVAKSVNIGFILERLAPTFKKFPFEHFDCRSVFDPIDYVIFEGLYKKGTVTKIIFTDIKTGNASLKYKQREIKALVENKKVEFKPY